MKALRNEVRITVVISVILSVLLILILNSWCKHNHSVYTIPKNLQKYLMYEELPVSTELNRNALQSKINDINTIREVRYWKKFTPPGKETTIIVVQVHKDIRGLQYLIISLAQVRYINSVVLVFSHSYYSEYINRLIDAVDFCKVMQIFYPNSVQANPHAFPGIDPTNCTDGSQTSSSSHRCQERDARATERKHHWWWSANFIFDQMQWSLGYTGTVIFLEENQYAAPDLLHMLQYVQRSLTYFPEVEIISFGGMYGKHSDTHLLTLDYWRPPFDVGIAFNRTTWKKIVELSSFYCMYDDCSWSYSLLNVFKNFPNRDVDMVACVAPRIIGVKQFGSDRAALDLFRVFSNLKLFPDKVNTVYLSGPNGRLRSNIEAPPRGNGGWADLRDHLLCLDPLTTVVPEGSASEMSRYDLPMNNLQ